MKSAFSLIEVILASALFTIFATSVTRVVIQSLDSTRLGNEQTIATQFAQEGLEAARSIRNQDFSALGNTAGTGVAKVGSVWDYSGANNVFDKYTRTISVSYATKDASGNFVDSGGFPNLPTKKVTSSVTWNVYGSRNNSVDLVSYLTNWETQIRPGGMLVYGDGGTTSDAIRYRILDPVTHNWSAAALAADVDGTSTNRYLRAVRLFSSSTRNEKVMVLRNYNGSTQRIYAQVYDGVAGTWGDVVQLSTWNATTLLDVRNFDGTYLANGDFMVVYSDNTATPKFRIWNGSSWSGASISTRAIGGTPVYIVLKNRSGSNEAMAAFFDNARDTNTQYFNGGSYVQTSWTLHTEHSAGAPTAAREHIDFSWSPNNTSKGALIYANSTSDRAMNIKIWTANGSGGGSWSATDDTTNQGTLGAMQVAANAADNWVACDKDTGGDIYCFKSDTTPNWTAPTNNILTTTSDTAAQRTFDIDFEGWTISRALVVYTNATSTPRFRTYNSFTDSFDPESTMTTLGGVLETVKLERKPTGPDILVMMGDTRQDLYTHIWDGTNNAFYPAGDGRGFTTHGISGSLDLDFWYDFAWDTY